MPTITPTSLDPRTRVAAATITAAPDDMCEAGVIALAVAAVLAAHPDGGMIDSHELADAMVDRRVNAGRDTVSWGQCRDYVQHLLRETAHVCRHADGHHYRVHAAEVCGPDCDRVRPIAPAARHRPVSACCHLETLYNGKCPMGCDD